MSHSYFAMYGHGYTVGSEDDLFKTMHSKDIDSYHQPVHLTLHASAGGELNGRGTSMTIGEGHIYNSGGKKSATINLTKKDALSLIKELQNWLIDEEESDDYGTMVEVYATYKIPSET